jgi:hypothetical protein
MGPIDAYIVYRFIKALVTPWDETDAFKKGIIDGQGKQIKDDLSDEDQKSYSLFDRLVFNIKRLIEKIPGGKTKIGTYAAALFLIREELGDEEGVLIFERSVMKYLKENNAVEPNYLEEQYLPADTLSQGNYRLLNNMLDMKGNSLPKGTVVVAQHDTKPISRVLGVDVYQLQVAHTGRNVVVSHEDIQEV